MLEEQGKPVVRETLCTADFAVAAAIPERYIPAPEQRMDLYRRIARVRTQEEGTTSPTSSSTATAIPLWGWPTSSPSPLLRPGPPPWASQSWCRRRAACASPSPARLCQGGGVCGLESTRAASSFRRRQALICPCG